jgi:hypothetical protein
MRVPVDKPFLRTLFLRHKVFLKKVLNSKRVSTTKNLIQEAQETQVNILLRILHLIIHGAIPVEKKVLKQIPATKQRSLAIFNQNHRKVARLLFFKKDGTKGKKPLVPLKRRQVILFKFAHHLPELLKPLFDKEEAA